jgi:hypothetical protein
MADEEAFNEQMDDGGNAFDEQFEEMLGFDDPTAPTRH